MGIKGESSFLKTLYHYISSLEDVFVGIGLLSVTLIVFVNVLTRYFLSFSFSWAEEVTRYIMVAVAFIGAAVCSRRGIHLGIDFFFNRFGRRARKLLAITISLLSASFTFILTYLSLKYIGHALDTGQRSPAMDVPMALVYSSITVGCGLMFLHFLVAAFKNWFEKEILLKSSEKGG